MTTDVLIVGGGMVGAALACGLSQHGFDVTLLEHKKPGDWQSERFDNRVSALTRASQRIFEHLGAWDGMLERRAAAYHRMQVWDADGFGRINFDAVDLGEPDLGWIIENSIVQRALWDVLEREGKVHVLAPAEVSSLMPDEQAPSLMTRQGQRIEAKLIVAADGARSQLRDLAGIGTKGWPYDQTAVVASLQVASGHGGIAYQKFMPGGPLALLPTGKDVFSLVWSVPPAQAESLLALDEDSFTASVEEAAEHCVGKLHLLGKPGAFPLRLQHAETYIAPGLALVGDAAHVIHPLAGQGVNLGLLDAFALLDVLVEAKAKGRVLGSHANLRRFERARMGDNLVVQGAMDGFKRLFSNANPPLRMLRDLGLNLTDRLLPVKNQMIRRAMGLQGELPSLAKLTHI